jgi:hypothetical protein
MAPVQKIKSIKKDEINIKKMNCFSFSISSVNMYLNFNLSHNAVMSGASLHVYQMSNKKDSGCIQKYININCRYYIKFIKIEIDHFAMLKHKLSIVNRATHHNLPKMFNTVANQKNLSQKWSSGNKLQKL